MTSAAKWCVQSRLRPCQRAAGGGGSVGIALEPAPDVVVEVLLRPEEPGERLAHDVGGVGREAGRDDRRRRTRRRPSTRAASTVSKSAPSGSPPLGAVGEAQPHARARARRRPCSRCRAAALVPRLPGLTASRAAVDHAARERRPSPSGEGFAVPKTRANVGLVLREEQLGVGLVVEIAPALAGVVEDDRRAGRPGWRRRAGAGPRPRPTTTGCGTTRWAAGRGSPPRGRDW